MKAFLCVLCIKLSRFVGKPQAYRIGAWLAETAYAFAPSRRAAVKENLRVVTGASGTVLDNYAREVYRNFSRNCVDVLYRSNMPPGASPDVRMEGVEALERALDAGKGAILLTAHLGNWELGAGAVATRWPLWVVAAEQLNPYLNAVVSEWRTSSNVKVMPIGQAGRRSLSALASGALVGIVGDQRHTPDTVELDFFGRRTRMPKGPGFLSVRSGAPVVGAFMAPEVSGKGFALKFYPPLWPQEHPEPEFYQKVADMLQDMIRTRPTQWFCFHDMWKGPVQN